MEWTRETAWRQGNVIAPADAATLGLTADGLEDAVVVVVSHDCDLALDDLEDEPAVEVIVGRLIGKSDGSFSFGKHPRRLHLEFKRDGTPTNIELTASAKMNVSKPQLAPYGPDPGFDLPAPSLGILQRWLASRYHRQALPDELVERLRPVKFEKAGKSGIHGIIGFWLDYDPNDNSLPQDQTYELAVNVVYAADDVAHEKAAVEAARALRTAFEAQFKKDGKWKSIELVRCEAVSERDFTMRDMRETVNFRLEHLSLRAGPDAPMSPE